MHPVPPGLPRALPHVSWAMGGVLRPIFKVENPTTFPLHTQPVMQQKEMERLRGSQAQGHRQALGSRQGILKRDRLSNKGASLKPQRDRLVAMSLLLPEAMPPFLGPGMLMEVLHQTDGLGSHSPSSNTDGKARPSQSSHLPEDSQLRAQPS